MKQTLHVISTPDGPRVATLTRALAPRAGAPMVLLPNTGLNGRVGPHRINVRIARHLAQACGLHSLRVDLAGLGDSPASTANRRHEEQAVADLRSVMDHLQQHEGATHFLIVGICSGAYDGWLTAVQEPRVSGLALIDGPAYPSPKTRRAAALQALRWRPPAESAAWVWDRVKAKLGAGGAAVPMPSEGEETDSPTEDSDTPFPLAAEDFAQQAQALVNRGCAIYMLNTSTWRRFYSYDQQFADVFGAHDFAARMQVDYEPGFDHTFSRIDAQARFLARLQAWIDTRFKPS